MSKPDYDEEVKPEEIQDIPIRSRGLRPNFLLQPIGRLMHTKLGTVPPEETIMRAAKQMVKGHYGCVLVVENKRLTGILSERDIITKVVVRGKDPGKESVVDHMTPDPECLQPEDAVAYALNIMAVGGFRHVPVVDDRGILKGIFSIRDLKRQVLDHFEKEITTLPPIPRRQGPLTRYGG